jgi:hypothetical protein
VEIKLIKSCEVIGVPYKKGDIVECAPKIGAKYIKIKYAEAVILETQPAAAVEALPLTGSLKAENNNGN